MLLTDNNNAFLDKIFKVRQKTKSSRQPLEAIPAPQTPNLPVIESFKSPQLKNKKKRSRKFSNPSQKRCKRGTCKSGIKSAWMATTLLTAASVYETITKPALKAFEPTHECLSFKGIPEGCMPYSPPQDTGAPGLGFKPVCEHTLFCVSARVVLVSSFYFIFVLLF